MEKKSSDTTKTSKLESVAKILGLLEEKGKNKDWLLEELRHCNAKLRVSPTANSSEILRTSPTKALDRIASLLQNDTFEIKEINEKTRTFHWFFTDIVGSSDPKIQTTSQIRKITLLQNQIKNTPVFKNTNLDSSVILPTGDGMAIGFSDSPETPLLLAVQLHESLNKYNKTRSQRDKIHIRIGIDTGPVYFIRDLLGDETVWGPGIIMARRMMDLCGDDQIFASGRIGSDISKLSPQYKAIMHPIGDYAIKHGEQLLVYNVYGKNFGNKNASKKGKIIEKARVIDHSEPDFKFDFVEIRLNVLDTKTMLTHHTWVWGARSMGKEPLKQIFYDIGGDVPKDFSELQISVKDENENQLQIISIDVNKPLQKQFHVRLNKALKIHQKVKLVLEYDWEETDGFFAYKFPAECRKFKYVFTAPKDLPITKNRVLQNFGLGKKGLVEQPPNMNYSNGKTIITWETEEKQIIAPSTEYEFQWK